MHSQAGRPLSPDELDLVERFETQFNAIHEELRRAVGADAHIWFTEAVTRYAAERHYWAEDAEFLRQIARLRNTLVHERTRPHAYLAIPAPDVVARLDRIYDTLTNPPRAIPVFGRDVVTVEPRQSLRRILELVSTCDFSQFPVFDDGGRFVGLLTENGITRWLAHHAVRDAPIAELEAVTVADVLSQEEARENTKFVTPLTPVVEVKSLFTRHDLLEAVLVTEDGQASPTLLGIATRWDVIALA